MSFNKYALIGGIACILLGSAGAIEDFILRGGTCESHHTSTLKLALTIPLSNMITS